MKGVGADVSSRGTARPVRAAAGSGARALLPPAAGARLRQCGTRRGGGNDRFGGRAGHEPGDVVRIRWRRGHVASHGVRRRRPQSPAGAGLGAAAGRHPAPSGAAGAGAMSGAQVVFGAGELAVVVLAGASLVAASRLARSYRIAGWSLAAAAVLWLVAEGVRLVQLEAVLPALPGPDHESARMLVTLLGDTVYFGLGGAGV